MPPSFLAGLPSHQMIPTNKNEQTPGFALLVPTQEALREVVESYRLVRVPKFNLAPTSDRGVSEETNLPKFLA